MVRLKCLVTLCLSLITAACALALPSPTFSVPLPSVTPTESVSPSPPPTPTLTRLPTATPEPEDTGWTWLSPGVEWRRLWTDTDAGRERLSLVRLDPNQIRLRVVYQPTHPRRISEWAAVLPDAEGVNLKAFGYELFTTYLLPMQVTGFLLLIAMVGVIALSKKTNTQ